MNQRIKTGDFYLDIATKGTSLDNHPGAEKPQIAEKSGAPEPLEPKPYVYHADDSLVATKKKKGWFAKIESRDDALKMVRDTSKGFFFLAVLQTGLSFLIGSSILFDAIIYAVSAFFLFRYKSRAAALVLLVLTVLATGVSIANKVGANFGGGNNIVLALIVLWASVRTVEATFKLHGRFSAEVEANEAPFT